MEEGLGGVWRGVPRRGGGLQCLPRLPLRLLVSLVHRFKSEAAAAAVEEEEGCAAPKRPCTPQPSLLQLKPRAGSSSLQVAIVRKGHARRPAAAAHAPAHARGGGLVWLSHRLLLQEARRQHDHIHSHRDVQRRAPDAAGQAGRGAGEQAGREGRGERAAGEHCDTRNCSSGTAHHCSQCCTCAAALAGTPQAIANSPSACLPAPASAPCPALPT